ncbi:MAG: carboxyl transferase domain-containing protein, partial [Fidelibacterota bacterium]
MADHFYYPFEKDGRLNADRSSYNGLTEYEKYQLSFHPERPKYLDFLPLFHSVTECFDSDDFGACLIQTHRATLDPEGLNLPVMLIGQQTGPTSNYGDLLKAMADPEQVRKWNHGMPTPAAYRRATQAVRAASNENRLIIIFVDTPGADPTEASEAGGIAWRIGETIQALVEAKVPTLAIILNRACSGGAIALTGCDRVLALEYSTYLVITPEACSSILFHTRSRADEAASVSKITSREGLRFGIVDELIPEGDAPAHRNPEQTRQNLYTAVLRHCRELHKMGSVDLWERRIVRWKTMGHWDEAAEKQVRRIQHPVSRLPRPNQEGFLKRHSDCRDSRGFRIYDPVDFMNE